MKRIVFMLEEYSMKTLLEGLLPRLIPDLQFICIPHEGKQDLEKSIPRKLKGWNKPEASFIIVRDNDGGNCQELKKKLVDLCNINAKRRAQVRIVCQELEAWYFGSPEALSKAFSKSKLGKIGLKARYRVPDSIHQPSKEIKRIIPEFQKVSGARKMALLLDPITNSSRSFQAFIKCVKDEFLEMKN